MTVELIAGVNVSRETFDRLTKFQAMIEKWNKTINLVSKSSIDDIWHRHILDSVQVFALSPEFPKIWVDMGSGGGLPGIVIACLLAEKSSNTNLHFIESDARKSVFLRTALRELGVSGTVHTDRIEKVEPLNADVISARALAELGDLIGLAQRHSAPAATYLFPKGKNWQVEVTEARKRWNFTHQTITSETDPNAVLLRIEGISNV